jgi:antitoxin HicB
MASRHAASSFDGRCLVGNQKQLAAWQDRSGSFLCTGRRHGAPARLHQENTEDSATRACVGTQTEERWWRMKKKNIGSSFDSWLSEEGIREEVTATAIKRVLARQVEAAMIEKNFSKAEMARRMNTSRAALDRLLDPEYEAVTLSTLRKAATAVGRELRLELR